MSLAAAVPALFVDPPASDLLYHGLLAQGAADAWHQHGWSAFQDPWVPGLNWGYPLLHSYPHLAHQLAAGASWLGVPAYLAAGWLLALLALSIPGAAFVGARWLGLAEERAGLAALAAASLQSADTFGHTPLAYSFEGAGLLAQALGGVLAALSIPALVAAGRAPEGSTLGPLGSGRRVALAAVLLSLTVRAHLVAGWVAPLVAGVLLVGLLALERAEPREWAAALGRLVAAGAGAAVLAAGFLLPFLSDLGAVNDSVLATDGRSYGLLTVLKGVLGGRFLDAGRPGVWTVALALALVGLRRARVQGRMLGLGLLALVLLMAGRATWGDWMNALPLIGRFHDQRYLLGVHLVVPWLIAAGAPVGLEALRRRAGRWAPWVTMGALFAVALGGVGAFLAGSQQLGTARAARQQLAEWRPGIDPLVEQALELRAPVLRTFPEELEASTTALGWMRRQGVWAVGRPLQHYNHGYELAFWLHRNPPADLEPEAVEALGLGALLRKADGYRLERVSDASPDVALVRADLLLESAGPSTNGAMVAAWSAGLWRVGQAPAFALAGRSVDGTFLRRASLERPEAGVFAGLPPARGGEVLDAGEPLDGVGTRTLRVRSDEAGTWLKVAQSWHPRLAVTVDGRSEEPVLLWPGHLGVPLGEPGEREVTVTWAVPPWRGPWAALNVALVLGLLVWVGRPLGSTRPSPPAPARSSSPASSS